MLISLLIELDGLLLIKVLAPLIGGGGILVAVCKVWIAYIRRDEKKTVNLKDGIVQGYSEKEAVNLLILSSIGTIKDGHNGRQSSVSKVLKS